jgi:hypothetical protein
VLPLPVLDRPRQRVRRVEAKNLCVIFFNLILIFRIFFVVNFCVKSNFYLKFAQLCRHILRVHVLDDLPLHSRHHHLPGVVPSPTGRARFAWALSGS